MRDWTVRRSDLEADTPVTITASNPMDAVRGAWVARSPEFAQQIVQQTGGVEMRLLGGEVRVQYHLPTVSLEPIVEYWRAEGWDW